jgi:hypothetical protein
MCCSKNQFLVPCRASKTISYQLVGAAILFAALRAEVAVAGCAPAPAGLVSWWRGENSTADAVGGNNGTIAGTGTVTYGPGVVGQAFVFDGTHRDRIDLGNPANLQLQDFTLEAWVKRSSPTVTSFDVLGADGSVAGDGACIIGYGRGGYILAVANDGRLILSRTDIDGIFSAPLLTDTNWHHLAVTKAGSNAVFYVDGVPQATPAYVEHQPYTFDDATCSCTAAIAIGSRGDARGGTFYGMIDEPAVFNRALSASEIRSIYAAGSAGLCTSSPACVPAPAGLVSWWRGENSTADAVGGNNGTIAGTGTVTYGPGVVGQAFVFDGTHRDRIDLGNPANLQLQDFTLEAWVKRSSPTVTSFDVLGADGSVAGDGACIIGYGRGGYILAVANDGRLILSRTDIDGVISAALITDVNWHHLAVTKAGSNAVFYVDGVAQATPAYVPHEPYTFDDATCSCTAAIAIGSRGDARGGTFYGMIDEPAVFNRALSASEIQSIYAAGSAGMCTSPPACVPAPAGLVSWWRGENSAADAVGGNNGTIAGTGTVTYGPGVVGQAFVFDGTHRDRIDLGNPTNLQLQDFTLEAWVKRSSPTVTSFDNLGADGSVAGDGACIIGYGRGGYILAVANDGRLILSRTDIDGVISAALITDTNWHHLAVTKAGSNAVFYVDGAPQATPAYVEHQPYTFDDATCSCTAAIAIGSRGDARGGTFYGMIDEPAVFNRALSANEIQSIFAAGSAGMCPVVNHPPVADAGATLGLVISANNSNATVVLNGTRSSDADGDVLQYLWFKAGAADPIATGAVAVVALPLGTNVLTLSVSDGLATNSQTFTVEVISTAQAVAQLVTLCQSGASGSQPLIAKLSAALAAIDRSNPTAAINQLQAFQNQVRAQVAPLDQALADTFIQDAQNIIDALGGGSKANGKLTLVHTADGTVRLRGAATPGVLYIIETSTNLLNWENIGVATDNGTATFEFEDTNALPASIRFYRVLSP